MKKHFLDLAQVVFSAGQKTENIFSVPGAKFKRPFIDLAEVAFWAGQEGENEF